MSIERLVQIRVQPDGRSQHCNGGRDITSLLEHLRSSRHCFGNAAAAIRVGSLQGNGPLEGSVRTVKVAAFQCKHAEAKVRVTLIWIKAEMMFERGLALFRISRVVVRPAQEVGRRWVGGFGSNGLLEPRHCHGVCPLAVVGESHQEQRPAVTTSGIDQLPQSHAGRAELAGEDQVVVVRQFTAQRWNRRRIWV